MNFCVRIVSWAQRNSQFLSLVIHSGPFALSTQRRLTKTPKIDYREVLSEKDFAKYVKLRDLRKKFAEKEGTPAFTIFTNEQLAELAKMDHPTLTKMETIPGIGKSRIEKYGKVFLQELNQGVKL